MIWFELVCVGHHVVEEWISAKINKFTELTSRPDPSGSGLLQTVRSNRRTCQLHNTSRKLAAWKPCCTRNTYWPAGK
jgi:hypothetical protein